MTDGKDGPDPAQSIFDAHFHIIDPRFPLIPNNGYLPESFTAADYIARTGALGIVGGAVVSGSFQGSDQSYLLDALDALGPTYFGVTQLPESVSDAQIRDLAAHRVRAVRFNLYRGGSGVLENLERLARRAHEVAGWHAELYLDARDLPDLADTLVSLPAVSIDHLGLSSEGLPHLLRLAEAGVRVKATGFGRLDFEVPPALRALAEVNPHALMFGTDLPSTRAPRPFQDDDLTLLAAALGPAAARAALFDNAWDFYEAAESG